MGVGHADVLARADDHAARDVERVLTRGEHAREPVERGAALAPPHALVERGDHVVVAVPAAVVRGRDGAPERVEQLVLVRSGGGTENEFDERERRARITRGECDDRGEYFGSELWVTRKRGLCVSVMGRNRILRSR